MKTPEEMAKEYAEIMSFDVRKHQKGFLAGYKAAQPQWISVKERLPEMKPRMGDYWLTSTCVLIATKEQTIHVAHLTHWTKEPEADWAACDCDTPGHDVEPNRWSLSEVTHWMPLPTPPEEEK